MIPRTDQQPDVPEPVDKRIIVCGSWMFGWHPLKTPPLHPGPEKRYYDRTIQDRKRAIT